MYDHSFLCMLKTDRKSTKALFGWDDFYGMEKGKRKIGEKSPPKSYLSNLERSEVRK